MGHSSSTSFKPGNSGRFKPGNPGRPVGVTTRAKLAEEILRSLDKLGGIDYLIKMAQAEPKAYLTLIGRLVPSNINMSVEGRLSVLEALKLKAGIADKPKADDQPAVGADDSPSEGNVEAENSELGENDGDPCQ